MLQNQHVASKINTTDQTVYVYVCWEFITLHFQALNKLKMGTSLCDVTVTLKRQRKIVNIFFLKQNTFFYKKMYVWHFYQKCTRNYTGAYTIQLDESFYKNTKQTIKLLSHGYVRSQNYGFWERFSGRLLRSSLLGFTQACSTCVYAVSPEP